MSWDADVRYWQRALLPPASPISHTGPVDDFDAALLERLTRHPWPDAAGRTSPADSAASLPTPPEFATMEGEQEDAPAAAISGEFLMSPESETASGIVAGTTTEQEQEELREGLQAQLEEVPLQTPADAPAASVSGEFMVVKPHAPAEEAPAPPRRASIEVQGPMAAASGTLDIQVEPVEALETGEPSVGSAPQLEVELESVASETSLPHESPQAPPSVIIPTLTRVEAGGEPEAMPDAEPPALATDAPVIVVPESEPDVAVEPEPEPEPERQADAQQAAAPELPSEGDLAVESESASDEPLASAAGGGPDSHESGVEVPGVAVAEAGADAPSQLPADVPEATSSEAAASASEASASKWIPAADDAEYQAARARAYYEAYEQAYGESHAQTERPAAEGVNDQAVRPEVAIAEQVPTDSTLEVEADELDAEELEVVEVEEVEDLEVVDDEPAAPPAAPPAAEAKAPPKAPPKPSPKAAPKRRRRGWYEDAFGEHYPSIERRKAEKSAELEVQFMIEVLGLQQGARVLDVGSGSGHHAFAFATAGMQVTGVDNSLPLLLRASEKNESKGAGVTFLHADMRELPFDGGEYDAVTCIGTTLGYYDDEQNRQALDQMSRQVKPGGRMLVHVFNRDNLVGQLPTRSWWQGQRCLVLDEAEMHYFTNRLRVHRTVVFEDGRQFDHHISIRAYTVQELGRLLQSVGLKIAEISGSIATPRRFYGSASPDLWIVGEKPPA